MCLLRLNESCCRCNMVTTHNCRTEKQRVPVSWDMVPMGCMMCDHQRHLVKCLLQKHQWSDTAGHAIAGKVCRADVSSSTATLRSNKKKKKRKKGGDQFNRFGSCIIGISSSISARLSESMTLIKSMSLLWFNPNCDLVVWHVACPTWPYIWHFRKKI